LRAPIVNVEHAFGKVPRRRSGDANSIRANIEAIALWRGIFSQFSDHNQPLWPCGLRTLCEQANSIDRSSGRHRENSTENGLDRNCFAYRQGHFGYRMIRETSAV